MLFRSHRERRGLLPALIEGILHRSRPQLSGQHHGGRVGHAIRHRCEPGWEQAATVRAQLDELQVEAIKATSAAAKLHLQKAGLTATPGWDGHRYFAWDEVARRRVGEARRVGTPVSHPQAQSVPSDFSAMGWRGPAPTRTIGTGGHLQATAILYDSCCSGGMSAPADASRHISTMDLRARLGDVLDRVRLRFDTFAVERKGEEFARRRANQLGAFQLEEVRGERAAKGKLR